MKHGYIIDCTSVRYKPYKLNSQQAKNGIKGRWQKMVVNGDWHNWENMYPEPIDVFDTPDGAARNFLDTYLEGQTDD